MASIEKSVVFLMGLPFLSFVFFSPCRFPYILFFLYTQCVSCDIPWGIFSSLIYVVFYMLLESVWCVFFFFKFGEVFPYNLVEDLVYIIDSSPSFMPTI